MLNFGKMARLILFTTLPALAMAQSAQVSSMPQSASPQAIQATPVSTANTASSPNGSVQDATATVEYVKGQLTVISHGAPLGSVLKLVSTKTGALVALAPELQNEPVVGQLGPGTVREVVTSLLDSPRIGYILMGAGNDPDRLQKIVVQSRRPAGPGAMAGYHPPPQDDEENKIDENGKLPSGLTPEESKMSQDEIRANWQRIRDQKLQAEILQQKQDREREQLEESQPQPPPQTQPQPNNPPQQ
jgi:hypothetical protein